MTGQMPTSPRTVLRAMLSEPNPIVLPGVYDALSATLAQRSGFRALYVSGAAVSMSLIGYPDLGFVTLTELAQQAARIASVVDVPLVVDADTGFGNPVNVMRTVREYEQAGVSGIQLEDQTYPKRCGHLAGKDVVASEEFVEKLHAAVEARRDPETIIVARTDARATLGYDEAIARANRYAEAGADVVFVEAPQSVEEIARIPSDVNAPVLFNAVVGGLSPQVGLAELAEWGYAMVILPGALIAPVVRTIARALARNGAPTPIEHEAGGPAGLFESVGLNDWLAAGKRYSTG